MFISGLTAANISTTVWTQATRSLTKMGALSAGGALNQSLAGAATATIQPGGTTITDVFVAVTTNAAAASGVQIIFNDGTNQYVVATVAANATGSFSFPSIQNAAYIQLKNLDATHAATYAYTQKQWVP